MGGATNGTQELVTELAPGGCSPKSAPQSTQAAVGWHQSRGASRRHLNHCARTPGRSFHLSQGICSPSRVDPCETGADSVVVRLRTCGHTCFERAVAAVSNSAFGTGGAAHRVGGGSGWIDHGHHAAFLRRSFELNGGYDPALGPTRTPNSTCDYGGPAAGSGSPRSWRIDYIPRGTPSALARQYFRYGLAGPTPS